MGIAVPASHPAQDFQQFVAWLRAQANEVTYGSPAAGSGPHFLGDMTARAVGGRVTHVPYRGAAPAVTDLIAGNIDLMVDNLPNILGQITGGQVRALAVATAERLPQLPEVPTSAEAGLPGFVFGTWFGLVAPARTPPEIVARLSAAVDAALREPEIGGRWRAQGAIVVGGTPEAFAAFIATQTAELEPVIRAANIRAE
jgi:tripartite-type tricarboxylate transporter receptor subunit TctC